MNSSPDNFNNTSENAPAVTLTAEVQKNIYTKTHAVFALLALVLGSLWYNWIFNPSYSIFGEYRTVMTTLFTLVFAAFSVSFFKLRGAKIGTDGYIMLTAMLVFSLRFTLYPLDYTGSILGIAYLVLHVSALLFLRCVGTPGAFDTVVGDTAKAVLVDPFASFHTLFASFSAFFALKKSADSDKEKSKKIGTEVGLVFLGLFFSLPILAVVLSLLGSDSFFANFIGDAIELLEKFTLNINIGDYINIITVLVSLFIYGALYSADKKSSAKPESVRNYGFLPLTVTKTVSIALLAVYVIFVISQVDGFAHMFMGELPEGRTYASFARSGFFELCAVACINGAVLYYSELFAIKKDVEKRSRILQFLVIGFTLFLIFTAAVKMLMYISAYGFTPKRFYTLWFMVLLTMLFIFAIVKFRRAEFKMSRYSVYVTLAMLAVLLLIDFEGISEWLNATYFNN